MKDSCSPSWQSILPTSVPAVPATDALGGGKAADGVPNTTSDGQLWCERFREELLEVGMANPATAYGLTEGWCNLSVHMYASLLRGARIAAVRANMIEEVSTSCFVTV